MKNFILILAMLSATLAAQSTLAQTSKTKAAPATKQPQTVVNPTAKSAQTHQPQKSITFTVKQLDEYEDKILDRAEAFYNNRMTVLLWTMGIIMAAGLAIVGILIPMILEWYRKRNFEKVMDMRTQELKVYTEVKIEKLKTELMMQIDDREDKQTKGIASNFSMIYSGIGGLLSSQISQAAYGLMLQAHVLAMKFSIIGQCPGGCLTASQIIYTFSVTDKGKEITLDTLKTIDAEIENMKGDIGKITDDEKRVDMESQVRDLQIFVHGLINEKQQADEQ